MHDKKLQLRKTKLSLARETIRELNSQSLARVVGRAIPISEPDESNCPGCVIK